MRLLLFFVLALLPLAAHAQGLTVMAAASLTDAMRDIGTQWEAAGHPKLTLSFGSSSTLARQIEQGAPANVFASADELWMDYLAKRDVIAADTRINLLNNDLVLVVPAGQPRQVTIAPGLDMVALLGPGGRLAVGDPAHVPVGLYARQALQKLGLWDSIEPRLARTEDVRAALRFVERGEAPLGIVYATDAAVSKGVAIAGIFPPDSYDRITYPFAVIKSGDNLEARALMAFMASKPARDMFLRRGFKVP
jgi:molybdate transport system substrate-binding protein